MHERNIYLKIDIALLHGMGKKSNVTEKNTHQEVLALKSTPKRGYLVSPCSTHTHRRLKDMKISEIAHQK